MYWFLDKCLKNCATLEFRFQNAHVKSDHSLRTSVTTTHFNFTTFLFYIPNSILHLQFIVRKLVRKCLFGTYYPYHWHLPFIKINRIWSCWPSFTQSQDSLKFSVWYPLQCCFPIVQRLHCTQVDHLFQQHVPNVIIVLKCRKWPRRKTSTSPTEFEIARRRLFSLPTHTFHLRCRLLNLLGTFPNLM